MRKLVFIIAILFAVSGFSQRWHFQYGFKVAAGKNFIQGDEKVNNGYNFNYQIGFTGRITRKILIMDLGLLFQYSPYFNSSYYGHTRTNTTGLNIPMTVGVFAINKPLFKWNFQAGVQNTFIFSDGFNKKWPSDALVYNPYNLSGIISTGIEIAWFTFDIYYQPGITPVFKGFGTNWRHSANVLVGFIF